MNTDTSINVLLALNTRGRIFRTLGSRRAILSWDETAKTVTITARSADGLPEEQIMSVNVQQIQRVYIVHGNYIFRINGQVYDMQIEHYKGQRNIVHDILDSELGGLATSYADSKSESERLVQFLKRELPSNIIVGNIVSSNTRVKFAVGMAIVVVVAIIVVSLVGRANG